MERFIWSDGWLLTTLYYCSKPVTRAKVISTGDFLNRAIFTNEEIEGGIRRLENAGYAVYLPGGLYAITPRGVELVDSLEFGGMIDTMLRVAEWVKGKPCRP